MLIAVISDVHSNCFALEAVLKELLKEYPDKVLLLGDSFGYYPWAVETYDLLRPHVSSALLGNHDKLLIDTSAPVSPPGYWAVAQANRQALCVNRSEALQWLQTLSPELEFAQGNWRIRCVHGTPEDPLNGRFYPDNLSTPAWMPTAGEVLLMGHTHYPMVRKSSAGGFLLNPGSVGQPRDSDPRASWALLSLPGLQATVRRTEYNVQHAISELERMDWYSVAISALRKHKRS
jgi:putative phosphoesterase